MPIDLLLRITAQSISGLQNGTVLGGPNSSGAPQFFELIQALRHLQMAGELNIETRSPDNSGNAANDSKNAKDSKDQKESKNGNTDQNGGIFITLGATRSGEIKQVVDDLALVRKLLHLSPKMKTYEVVY